MAVRVSHLKGVNEFLSIAGEILYSNETANNLILGVAQRLVDFPNAYQNPFFAVVRDADEALILAALMTPPHNMILAGGENYQAGVIALVRYLYENPLDVPGVIGPAHIAVYFSDEWQKVMGQPGELSMVQKVYELRSVHMPPMPVGQFRKAIPDDIPIIAGWLQSFEEEALGKSQDVDTARAGRLVNMGSIFVLELEKELVSMAMKTRPLAHSITIGGVYTPPTHRRKGYATAVVARLSQHLLESGYQFVNLFTDMANPTSNSIYRKIGYHPVCDFRMYAFIGEDVVGR